MSVLPYSETQIADEIAAFADKITDAKARWCYCFERASYKSVSRYGGEEVQLNERTFPVCDRILGIYAGSASYRLRKIKALGIDAAFAWALTRDRRDPDMRPYFNVGPMQAWHVGHVYFARVESHPHVLKIGFSRRVRERLEDIESKNKTALVVRPRTLRVGTLADEHWWHKNWRDYRISGEWFFDPFQSERSLPEFLIADQAKGRAA